ncbi:phosphate ABC transporter permease subunit PstC [Cloacibacillus sp. An23]|uniref:phosphate ABC transporter permease subunit PstC n=1 Tax=Cloacibacillus sp. An23 TaxID=1965591 RepID=UPI000B3AD4F0|nr:phosphate ABC transporter permease subunit PstC [Cloacibacillus sp. An23]OUO94982.1 phosphate ABC transporter permease subunit PstC [Cloacibacillus sp. An23]
MNSSANKTASIASQGFGGRGDRIMSRVVFCVAVTGIVVLIFILGFLVANGLPVLESTSLGEMFFSKDWYPTEEPPALGMAALIAGTLAATVLSSVMAIPVSIALAIFSAEIAPRKVRQFFKVLFEMLGFLPSIVLGFIGMMIIAPWMQVAIGIPSGLNLLNSSILLGFLIIPSVASLSDEALAAVPGELRDASYALGATRLETIFKVVFPSALPGIIAATLLGVMRALGETMVVLMAAGGAAILPTMFTDPIRPLTSTIAAEMGETPVGSTHYHALFFAGLILLIMTLAINLASLYIEKRGEKR